jgi:hypothetical protein
MAGLGVRFQLDWSGASCRTCELPERVITLNYVSFFVLFIDSMENITVLFPYLALTSVCAGTLPILQDQLVITVSDPFPFLYFVALTKFSYCNAY